jgi:hypothetical protein
MPQQQDQQTLSPPSHIAVRLPNTTQLQSVLLSHIIEFQSSHAFVRAAWNALIRLAPAGVENLPVRTAEQFYG